MGNTGLSKPHIYLRQGNVTLRRLMVEVLEEAGFFVHADAPASLDVEGQLLIVDIDSPDGDWSQMVSTFRDEGKPILICGLQPPADEDAFEGWLKRPFPGASLVQECRGLLQQSQDNAEAGESQTKACDEDDTQDRLVDIRALVSDEIVVLTDNQRVTEEMPSVSVRIPRNTPFAVGDVRVREVELSELAEDIAKLSELRTFQRSALYQTMPDAPSMLHRADVVENSQLSDIETPPFVAVSMEESAFLEERYRTVTDTRNVDRGQWSAQWAELLGSSWDRIGGTARHQDRSERLKRILLALDEQGVEAGREELARIPETRGLFGSLSVISVPTLLRMLCDSGCRGRLELSVEDFGCALYLNAGVLDDIHLLGSEDDETLLLVLYENQVVQSDTYKKYMEMYARESHLLMPLEMKLRQDEQVSDAAIKHAKRLRAQWIIEVLLDVEDGTFAFNEISRESGDTWPIDSFDLEVTRILDASLSEVTSNAQSDAIRQTGRDHDAKN